MVTVEWIVEAAVRKYKASYRAQTMQHQVPYSEAEKIAEKRSVEWALGRLKYVKKADEIKVKTLRDEIAISAMHGMMAAGEFSYNRISAEIETSFRIADEFLKQRNNSDDR